MGQRQTLKALLETCLGEYKRNLYFQPPEDVRLRYPCIIYQLSYEDTKYADNIPFARKKRYSVNVIDRNPDSQIPDRVASLPTSKFERFYTSGNLNHTVYNIYY